MAKTTQVLIPAGPRAGWVVSGTVASAPVPHATTNYAQFAFDPRNRPIDEGKLAKLFDSILENNLLYANPIVVTPDFVVIDGQHRLRVAEVMEVPIYYVVAPGVDAGKMMIKFNTAVKPWTKQDFLHFWCESGNQEYLTLREFLNRYDFMGIDSACRLVMHHGKRSNMRAIFEAGDLVCDNIRHAVLTAESARAFSPFFAHYRHVYFILSISSLMDHPGYDQDRMIRKMQHASDKLNRCTEVGGYLRALTAIYNYRAREESYVDLTVRPRKGASR
jgi:hypothetical protein